jgi:sortase A
MLLKAGVAMMTLALAFAVVVTAVVLLDEPMERTIAAKPAAESAVESPDRSYLPPEPRAEEIKPQREPGARASGPRRSGSPEAGSKPEARPESRPERLPIAGDDWPAPTDAQLEVANKPRHYDLPRGAVMGLTIKAIGLYNVPVYDSASQWALDNGVSHIPETSFPWSGTPQRNVYLAGHKLGWPGTDSHLVFYNLEDLGSGDEILLKNHQGHKYTYRVSETFVADPRDSWVMGQVRGRDMVTLQTCTGPGFEKRLIVRADRA